MTPTPATSAGAPGTTSGGPASAAPTSPPPPVASPTPRPLGAGDFDRTVAALRDRVAKAGLAGGAVLVVRDGTEVLDVAVGSGGRSVPLAVASTAKWLTAATLLTFVDDGTLTADDPVARWLPAFASNPPLTIRHLLTHTAGLRDVACIWQTGASMASCADAVAATPSEFAAGSAFSYGNASFHVVGRIIEVAGGGDFASIVRDRLTVPLRMPSTTWPGAGANPSPAAGASTTVDDYSHFLAMLLADGTFDGRRILSPASVRELVRNQIDGYDTAGDAAVAITRIPRYSFGAWPDEVDALGTTVIVSGNGARGFYPWIDLSTRSFGVVGVQDDRGAEVAVPASRVVAAEAWTTLRG